MGATLTDQLGAMALIDDMRHRQINVQEHLDLPKRRDEVATRIRDYYRAKNIPVADDVVEQGVRAYFDRRLVYEPGKIGRVAGALARVYIVRDRWIRPVANATLAIACVVAGGLLVHTAYVGYQVNAVKEAASGLMRQRDAARGDIQQQMATIRELQKSLSTAPVPAATRMLLSVLDTVSKARGLIEGAMPATINAETREDAHGQVDRRREELTTATMLLAESKVRLTDAGILVLAAKRLAELQNAPSYVAARAKYAPLQAAELDAEHAVAEADGKGVKPAVDGVARVTDLANDVGRVDAVLADIIALMQKFSSMGLAREDMDQVKAIGATAVAAAKQLDVKKAAAAVGELKDAMVFAETPLTINVVDRAGVKSGVERNYNASGGKSWFLIAEATDPSGKVVPVQVKSAETGVTKRAALFGVRVSREQYDAARAEKKRTGHISDRALGDKPANSLTIRYSRGIAAKPDYILEW